MIVIYKILIIFNLLMCEWKRIYIYIVWIMKILIKWDLIKKLICKKFLIFIVFLKINVK